jgi:hypothetical protein
MRLLVPGRGKLQGQISGVLAVGFVGWRSLVARTGYIEALPSIRGVHLNMAHIVALSTG